MHNAQLNYSKDSALTLKVKQSLLLIYYLSEDDLTDMYDEAKSYLVEKEIETVLKLRKLFYSKDFAVKT